MILLFSMVLSLLLTSQDVMPRDESGLITYYEVIELPGYPAEILMDNASGFLQDFSVKGSRKKHFNADDENLRVFNKGSYRLSNMWGLGKHTDGIVMFDMNVEVKEGRYRYIINHFIFQEFRRNRYGKFEPVKGGEKPLELEVSQLSARQWERHQEHAHSKIQSLIMEFKAAMATVEVKNQEKKKTKVEDDW
jgi:hypothetical protein